MAEQGNELGQQDAAAAFAILGLTGRLELLEELLQAVRYWYAGTDGKELYGVTDLENAVEPILAALDGAQGGQEVDDAG